MNQNILVSKLSEMLHGLTRDGGFLFTTRIARMFGYGFLSIMLVLYLAQVGLNESANWPSPHPDFDRGYDHLAVDNHLC